MSQYEQSAPVVGILPSPYRQILQNCREPAEKSALPLNSRRTCTYSISVMTIRKPTLLYLVSGLALPRTEPRTS